MDVVRVAFSRRHGIGSLLLRTYMWDAWSHCGLVDGDDVIEALIPHGVCRTPLAAFIKRSSAYEIIEIPVPNAEVVLAAVRRQVGKPYDYAGVLGIWFRRNWENTDRWFCSELVAWAIEHTRSLFRGHISRITPRDLYIRTY